MILLGGRLCNCVPCILRIYSHIRTPLAIHGRIMLHDDHEGNLCLHFGYFTCIPIGIAVSLLVHV